MTKAKAAATELAIFEPPNAVIILQDAAKFDQFYENIKRETDAHVPDLTTETGRKAIASLAYKVARTKTAIDDAGKLLTEEWRGKINVVDASRREIRERLDALKVEVRRPLTEWEEEDERRLNLVNETIGKLRDVAVILATDTAETVSQKLDWMRVQSFSEDVFQGHRAIAINLHAQAVEALESAHARILKEEADRAELEALRAQAQERAAKIEAERIEAEKAAEEAEAKHAQEERDALMAAKQEALLKAAADAAEKAARDKAEREATEVREAQEKAHAEALAAEKARADKAEADAKAEADRVLKEAANRAALLKQEADEQAARDKDRKHRGEVMGAAKAAIMLVGVSEETAKKVVLAIVAGEIPAVTLRF